MKKLGPLDPPFKSKSDARAPVPPPPAPPRVVPSRLAMGKAKDRLERLLDELNKDARGDDGDTDDTDATPSTVSGVTEMENEVEAIRRMAAAREGRDPDDGPHLGRLEMKVAQRTAKLEERLAILVEENVKKDERHLEAMVAKEKAFDAERQKMLDAVNHLKAKQTELERLAPPLREAIAEAKNDVQSVVCSQERLKELKTMDAKDLSLREFCVLRVHEETASLRADLDITRVERDAARDAASRAKLDNERLVRETRRATANISASEQDNAAERAALDARCERLSKDLEDALVRCEVLTAKGAMYDEVAASVDAHKTRAHECERAAAVASANESLVRKERDSLAEQLSSTRHRADLLTQDKAYLSREVDAHAERERKAEMEEDRMREKISELKAQRDDLREKLMRGNDEASAAHEERLRAEVERLRVKAAEDLAALREEHAAQRDREIRALKDLRDAAVNDASGARLELNDARRDYDDLLAAHRSSQKSSDVSIAQLTGELRMKAMELERISMLHGESVGNNKVMRMECEMLTKKCRLLEQQYVSLENEARRRQSDVDLTLAEQAARLEHYEALEQELDDAVVREAADGQAASVSGGENRVTALAALGGAVPASLRRRLQQSVALGRRCNELEKQCKLACDAKDDMTRRVEDLEQQLRRAQSRVSDATQPYNYLVDRIAAAENDADAAASRERVAVQQLNAAKANAAAAHAEADALRRDLKRALDERGNVAKLKAMLIKQQAGRSGGGRSRAPLKDLPPLQGK